MYRISEFSKITHLPVSTLRYYESIELLIPSIRDPQNNYRYYSEEDFKKAELLNMLRIHKFTIEEMKDVILTLESVDDISYYFSEKKLQLLNEIQTINNQISQIDKLINKNPTMLRLQEYCIEEVIIKEMNYICESTSIPYDEMGEIVHSLYSKAKNEVDGNLFMIDSFTQEDSNYLIALPVTSNTRLPHHKRLERCRGLQVTHYGSYETISHAYKFLIDTEYHKELKGKDTFIVEFVKGPGKVFRGNANSYITKVTLLIE